MTRNNLIEGEEVFEPTSESETETLSVLEDLEELRVLDHLIEKNQEGKKALAEALLGLGFSSASVERILHVEYFDERPALEKPMPIHEQADFVKKRKRVKPPNPLTPMAPFLEKAWLKIKEES